MSKRGQNFPNMVITLLAALMLAAVFSPSFSPTESAAAANPTSSRVYLRTSTRVYHHWVLALLDSDEIECHIYTVAHDPPGHEDVLGYCGIEVYQLWAEGPVCLESEVEERACPSLVLHDVGEIDQRLKTTIWLPGAEAHIELLNCNAWEACAEQPALKVTGYEPLQNHHIDSVHIEFSGSTGQVCRNSSECEVEFPETDQDGMDISVFVTSSYGDESEPYVFRSRVMPAADGTILFEVLHTSWDYLAPPESVAWGIFPELGSDTAPWLLRIEDADDLATSHDFALLAGRYILRGDVDIRACIYGGLTADGGATQCGLEQAQELIFQAQNQYDEDILSAGNTSRIPPRIIKGVIAQESQFWPDWYLNGEYGLGMLTDDGIEMMLIWNPVAFLDLCIPEYGADDCAWGYDSLGEYPQDYIRGLALSAVGTDREINLIAQTIVGAAAQTGQLIRNVTRREPYQVLSYQDMWKITLGLYNSGAGCMYYAIDEAWDLEGRLNWGSVSEYLIGDCQGAADYPNEALFKGVP
jgi:hypothetical protein